MPQGVVIAIRPIGSKDLVGSEEVQTDTLQDTSTERTTGAAEEDSTNAGCYGTVRIDEPGHENYGKEAKFLIPRGSRQQPCCVKKKGDPVTIDNIRVEKDGLHADITGNC